MLRNFGFFGCQLISCDLLQNKRSGFLAVKPRAEIAKTGIDHYRDNGCVRPQLFCDPKCGNDISPPRKSLRRFLPPGLGAGSWPWHRRKRPVLSSRPGPVPKAGVKKPMPIPSILWEPVGPPDSTADSAGSTATTLTAGRWVRRARAAPWMEWAVPTDWTKASTRPSDCCQISSPNAR